MANDIIMFNTCTSLISTVDMQSSDGVASAQIHLNIAVDKIVPVYPAHGFRLHIDIVTPNFILNQI